MTDASYVLFWEAQSGAIAPQAMFEEMGVAYEKRPVDMEAGEHQTAEYLAMLTVWHPDKPGLFARNPRLAKLCAAVEARPAYARALSEHL
ncbi:MAG: hypothetical protein WD489_09700 [Rhodovibrionaceae bacterium]